MAGLRVRRSGTPSTSSSWRIYQNELSIDSGFEGEQDPWLANFTDNPIEWFTQYRVRFAKTRRAYVDKLVADLSARVATEPNAKLEAQLDAAKKEQARYTDAGRIETGADSISDPANG